ncbi:hypothetical protein [Bradyrhizobium archetypum]|uniref:Uncharacterized protein n=1 Tax=Bradyrhizobium archetypum TaxID=2721160 RepID=A0A7Y4H4S7_9BRAD|nr:hypothetical protein [Bradyrhizobium archetypum]NOJ47635.1 hypothetical protein [Bradyrhizobium archetypum]
MPILPSSQDLHVRQRTDGVTEPHLPERSLRTTRDLLRQHGLGRLTMLRIEKWLEFRGRRFRRTDENLDSVTCRFAYRRGTARTAAVRRQNAGTTIAGNETKRHSSFVASETIFEPKLSVREVA